MSYLISIDNDQIKISIQNQYTSTGKVASNLLGFVEHSGLEYSKRIVGPFRIDLRKRLEHQAKLWQGEWIAKQETIKAKNLIQEIETILISGLKQKISLDWEKLKDSSKFSTEKPKFRETKPSLEDQRPRPNFIDKLFFKTKVEEKLKLQKQNYDIAVSEWKENKSEYEKELKKWENKKQEFYTKQEKFNKKFDCLKVDYNHSKAAAVEFFYESLFKQTAYPIKFERKIALQYKKKQKFLILDFGLPNKDEIPTLKDVNFVKAKEEFVEKHLAELQFNKLYDSVLYQICLKTIYEIFKADEVEAVDSVVLNGWVNTLNKATGKRQTICILSIQVDKKEFFEIDLENVDPKICFKTLKGVAASELSGLAPIAPILQIDKFDKRFIQGQQVEANIDNSTNIAAMDWEDFEHLVREIFEKEFENIKGEVKVTQSSRDRGVDAVAFDPDPIKGGKIIIQAKRYTNTVKVESVRALYGVMQDEGAMKGILITTSDFGPDAYSFAKNKPITLLNGNNLLSMLERQGHKAKINISEAKKILKDKGEI